MTSSQRTWLAVAVGSGVMLTLIGLNFVGQVSSFENLGAPAWQLHYEIWGILALLVPGVLVGLVENQKRWVAGAITGAIAFAVTAVAGSVFLAMKDSLYVDSWTSVVLGFVYACVPCMTFAWLTGLVVDRWSPNTSFERTREG